MESHQTSSHASQAIRVLLVDDHAMLRQGLKSLLQNYGNVEVVGEAADGEEAVTLASRLEPSVVVMDINMPKMNGIEATTRIHGKSPHLPIIGLSVNGIEHGNAILRAGAKAFVSKEAAVDRLYVAILNAVNCS
ncbi:MAG TPA: response regulator transcription factor [Anaerolineales bacterium]|nr:response regulator transcription factor [Anaerolineales bacterium]HEX5943959.1 response regulator transcription factor [Anaerolineales bacterium]